MHNDIAMNESMMCQNTGIIIVNTNIKHIKFN